MAKDICKFGGGPDCEECGGQKLKSAAGCEEADRVKQEAIIRAKFSLVVHSGYERAEEGHRHCPPIPT